MLPKKEHNYCATFPSKFKQRFTIWQRKRVHSQACMRYEHCPRGSSFPRSRTTSELRVFRLYIMKTSCSAIKAGLLQYNARVFCSRHSSVELYGTLRELNHYSDERSNVAPSQKAEKWPLEVVYQKQSCNTAVLGILPLEALVLWMQNCAAMTLESLPEKQRPAWEAELSGCSDERSNYSLLTENSLVRHFAWGQNQMIYNFKHDNYSMDAKFQGYHAKKVSTYFSSTTSPLTFCKYSQKVNSLCKNSQSETKTVVVFLYFSILNTYHRDYYVKNGKITTIPTYICSIIIF